MTIDTAMLDSLGDRCMTDTSDTAQMREAAARLIDDRCADILSKQDGKIPEVDQGLRLMAFFLPDLAAAIRALPVAEPDPLAVKIKPLEWVDFEDRGAKAQAWGEANYVIQRWSDGRYELSASYPGYGTGVPGTDQFFSSLAAAKDAANADNEARVLSQIDAVPAAQVRAEALREADYFGSLVLKARTAATKASIKFPQPNYVTLKIAEEAGEVVRGAVHYAEGRMEWAEIEGEIVQLLAMLIRFVTEGDEINGVIPPSTLPAAEPAPVAVNAVMCAAERDAQSRVAVDLTLFRQAVRAEALEEAATLPPYDGDGDPAGQFDHHVFVKRDAIRALMERETNE